MELTQNWEPFKNRMGNVLRMMAIAFVSASLAQCEEEGVEACKNDYFPLRAGSSWEMLRRADSFGGDGNVDTVQFMVDGDHQIINGLNYKKLMLGDNVVQLIRKEGGKYYARDVWSEGSFTEEFLFLDENAPVDSEWYLSSYRQHKVVAVNSTKTVNGVSYDHVIEMQINNVGVDGTVYSSASVFYARGVGEIYGSFPAGLSGLYSDLEKSLLKYTP